MGLAQTAGLAVDGCGTFKLCTCYSCREIFEGLGSCMSESLVPYVGSGNWVWAWLSCAGDECCWFVIFEDPLTMSLLDISEYLISEPELLLPGVPMYVLLHKAVERDDVRVKRRDEGDVA